MSEISLYWILAWAAILVGMWDGMGGIVARVGWFGALVTFVILLIQHIRKSGKGR